MTNIKFNIYFLALFLKLVCR